jgi:hypothetical protein
MDIDKGNSRRGGNRTSVLGLCYGTGGLSRGARTVQATEKRRREDNERTRRNADKAAPEREVRLRLRRRSRKPLKYVLHITSGLAIRTRPVAWAGTARQLIPRSECLWLWRT